MASKTGFLIGREAIRIRQNNQIGAGSLFNPDNSRLDQTVSINSLYWFIKSIKSDVIMKPVNSSSVTGFTFSL